MKQLQFAKWYLKMNECETVWRTCMAKLYGEIVWRNCMGKNEWRRWQKKRKKVEVEVVVAEEVEEEGW